MKRANKKAVAAALVASMMLAAVPMSAGAAWNQSASGSWSWTDGSMKATGWKQVNGKWYYFDSSGVMKTGWVKDSAGKWFFMDASGAMKTGWLKDDLGQWFYLETSGVMKTGWLKENGKWYFLNSSGSMKTGWLKDSKGNWYHLSGSGAMNAGFYTVKDKRYFSDASGVMQAGVIEVNGDIYYFDETGAMATGKVKVGNVTYTFDENGKASGTLKPTASKAFTTTNNVITSITPTAPSKPSGGGGYTPPTTTDPTLEDKDLTAETYNTFNFGTKYDTVTVYIGGMGVGTYDLSELKANQVVVEPSATKARNALTAPTLIFNSTAGAIELKASVKVEANATLPSVTVNTTSEVEIAALVTTVTAATIGAQINATGKITTLNAEHPVTISGTGVANVMATADVTLSPSAKVETITVPSNAANPVLTVGVGATLKNVDADGTATVAGTGTIENVTVKKELTVETGTTVKAVEVPAGATNAKVSGAGTVAQIDAKAPITVAVNTTTLNTTADVTVVGNDVTVGTINVETIDEVKVNAGAGSTVTSVTQPEGGKTATAGDGDIQKPVTAAAKPVLGTDFTVVGASTNAPTLGKLTIPAGKTYTDYQLWDGDSWETLLSANTENLAPGNHQLRVIEKGEVKASAPVTFEISSFTGVAASDSKYYSNSVPSTAWVGNKYYEIGVLATSKWVSKDGIKVYVDSTGDNKGDFGLYGVKGGVSKLLNTTVKMQYSANGSDWTTCTAGETVLTGMTAGAAYSVRMIADDTNTNIEKEVRKVDVTVANMPAAPSITAEKPAAFEGTGYLIGTTDKMEYREYAAQSSDTWAKCVFDASTKKLAVTAGKTYEVRVAAVDGVPAGKITMVTVPAYQAIASTMSILQLNAAEYTAGFDSWAGKPTMKAVTVTQTGNTFKLTGDLPYVDGFTGFSSDEAIQSGHYVFIKLNVPKTVKEASPEIGGITIKYNSIDGEGDVKTITAANFDTAYDCYVAYRVNDRIATPIEFTVDFDGEAGNYAPTTYKLDFSGLKLDAATAATVTTEAELRKALSYADAVTVNGTFELADTLLIPTGKTLTINAGKKLTLAESKTIDNRGTIVANDVDALALGLTVGGTVEMGQDIEANRTMIVPLGVTATLNMKGFDLTKVSEDFVVHANYGTYQMINRGTLTINGGGTPDDMGSILADLTKNSAGERNICNFGTLEVDHVKMEGFSNINTNTESSDDKHGFGHAMVDAYTTITNCDFEAYHTSIGVFRKANVTVSDSTLESKWFVTAGNGLVTEPPVAMTYTNCTMTSKEDVVLYMPSIGTATFDGCTLTGFGGLEVRGGATINVKNGTTIAANGEGAEKTDDNSVFNGSGGSITDYCGILILSGAPYGGEAITLNIDDDCTISSANGHGIRINANSTKIGVPVINLHYADAVITSVGANKEKLYLAESRMTGITVTHNDNTIFPSSDPQDPIVEDSAE